MSVDLRVLQKMQNCVAFWSPLTSGGVSIEAKFLLLVHECRE